MRDNQLYLPLFNLKKKKCIYRRYSTYTIFFKKSKTIKFSFLFFFLIKKKGNFFNKNIDYFFFNNIYLMFFKKIVELAFIFKNNIIFFTDLYCENLARISSLNLFLNKKNYIFFKIKNPDLSLLSATLNCDHNNFYFLFIKQTNIKYLCTYNYTHACPLVDYSIAPSLFNFFLPIIVDLNFSIFFYKFFFFSIFLLVF